MDQSRNPLYDWNLLVVCYRHLGAFWQVNLWHVVAKNTELYLK